MTGKYPLLLIRQVNYYASILLTRVPPLPSNAQVKVFVPLCILLSSPLLPASAAHLMLSLILHPGGRYTVQISLLVAGLVFTQLLTALDFVNHSSHYDNLSANRNTFPFLSLFSSPSLDGTFLSSCSDAHTRLSFVNESWATSVTGPRLNKQRSVRKWLGDEDSSHPSHPVHLFLQGEELDKQQGVFFSDAINQTCRPFFLWIVQWPF